MKVRFSPSPQRFPKCVTRKYTAGLSLSAARACWARHRSNSTPKSRAAPCVDRTSERCAPKCSSCALVNLTDSSVSEAFCLTARRVSLPSSQPVVLPIVISFWARESAPPFSLSCVILDSNSSTRWSSSGPSLNAVASTTCAALMTGEVPAPRATKSTNTVHSASHACGITSTERSYSVAADMRMSSRDCLGTNASSRRRSSQYSCDAHSMLPAVCSSDLTTPGSRAPSSTASRGHTRNGASRKRTVSSSDSNSVTSALHLTTRRSRAATAATTSPAKASMLVTLPDSRCLDTLIISERITVRAASVGAVKC